MDQVEKDVIAVLRSVFGPVVGATLQTSSPLLGTVPELDSMAVVAILTGLEERFGFGVEDDDVDGSTFASVSNLVGFVRAKLAA